MNKTSKVIKEDEDYQIIFKPPFVLSEDISLLICHRLDFETSGLLLVAKNKDAQEFYQVQFKNRQIKKKYLALVLGQPEKRKLVVEGFLSRAQKKPFKFESSITVKKEDNLDHKSFKILGKKSRWSKTEFKVLETKKIKVFKEKKYQKFNEISLIEARPYTGRRHQIRIHLSHLGYPILGDKVYNTKLSRKGSKILSIPHLQLFSIYLKFKNCRKQEVLVDISDKQKTELLDKLG